MRTGDRLIGPDQPPLVIAEIGFNYDGELAVNREMMRLTANASAECIQLQALFVNDEMIDKQSIISPAECSLDIDARESFDRVHAIWRAQGPELARG